MLPWMRPVLALSAAALILSPARAHDGKARPADKPAVDQVTLQDGRVVSAPILKETAEKLWLDMGFTVLEVPRTQIESIVRAKTDAQVVDTAKSDLFQVARSLPERAPKEL